MQGWKLRETKTTEQRCMGWKIVAMVMEEVGTAYDLCTCLIFLNPINSFAARGH